MRYRGFISQFVGAFRFPADRAQARGLFTYYDRLYSCFPPKLSFPPHKREPYEGLSGPVFVCAKYL